MFLHPPSLLPFYFVSIRMLEGIFPLVCCLGFPVKALKLLQKKPGVPLLSKENKQETNPGCLEAAEQTEIL